MGAILSDVFIFAGCLKEDTYFVNFIAKPDATSSKAPNRDQLEILQFFDIFDYSANWFGEFLQLHVDKLY